MSFLSRSNRTSTKSDRGLAGRLGITLVNGGRVQRDDVVMALVMGVPGFMVLLVLGIYPIANVLTLAFHRRSMISADTPAVWVGLENFRSVLGSEQFVNALVNDILFSYVVPIVVAAIIWRFMVNDSVGILFHAIKNSHLPIPNTWFASTKTAMWSVILIAAWKFFPFMVINFLARMQTIDEQLYEAARVDGAGAWQTFRHITLPSLMPVIVIVLLLRTIWTFNNWDVIALLTRGGPIRSTTTLPILVYNTMFAEFSAGRAAATAFIMTLILLVGMYFYLRAYKHAEERLQ